MRLALGALGHSTWLGVGAGDDHLVGTAALALQIVEQ